jgi:low temperature requirement protein LtrA
MAQNGQPRGARPTGEEHRATTFELFFDLVYVFALTQVTGYMAHAHTGYAMLQGLLLLALLWWTWEGFTWLGNQAYGGALRAGGAVALATMFVVALTIPEAWHDAPGGLDGPVVLVVAYIFVRCIHLTLSTIAAANDTALRRQVRITWIPELAGAALLLAGALIGGWKQTALFAGALLVAWGGVYLTSREGSWRVRSASHFNERHGLFILIALGESLTAIGFGAAQRPISTPLITAAVLGIAVALSLWWLYFDIVSRAAQDRLRDARGQARVRMALEAYSYGHFPIVGGIILTALGVEGVLAHAGETEPLGAFDALALFGGVALYLAGHLIFKNRLHYRLSRRRLITVLVLLAATPAAAVLPPLAALTNLVLILAVLILIEGIRYAPVRQRQRQA